VYQLEEPASDKDQRPILKDVHVPIFSQSARASVLKGPKFLAPDPKTGGVRITTVDAGQLPVQITIDVKAIIGAGLRGSEHDVGPHNVQLRFGEKGTAGVPSSVFACGERFGCDSAFGSFQTDTKRVIAAIPIDKSEAASELLISVSWSEGEKRFESPWMKLSIMPRPMKNPKFKFENLPPQVREAEPKLVIRQLKDPPKPRIDEP